MSLVRSVSLAVCAVAAVGAQADAHQITYNLGVGHPTKAYPHGGEIKITGGGFYQNAGKIVLTVGSESFYVDTQPSFLTVGFRLNNFVQGDVNRVCTFALEQGPPHVDVFGNQVISVWPDGSWVEGHQYSTDIANNQYVLVVRNSIDDHQFRIGDVLTINVFCPSQNK